MDRQLKKNVLSLIVLQMGGYLVPLLILPHLTRVLGVAGFGKIGFAAAFTMYFVLLVEWGFNLSATRCIAIARESLFERSKVFWDIIFARAFLTLVVCVILFLLLLFIPRLQEVSTLLCLGMMQVLASTISPAFYYQGVERMSVMALINLGMRAISIPLIFFLVVDRDQVAMAFAIQVGCFLLASLTNFFFLLSSGAVRWVRPKVTEVKKSLSDGFPLFLSSAGISLYTNSNAVILGFVATEAVVGYFVAAFTIVKAVVGLSGPFSQALFPRISHQVATNKDSVGAFLKKMLVMQGILGALLTIALLIFLPWGITWFYGPAFEGAIPVVAWLSPLPFIICLASAMGMQTLLPLGEGRWFSSVLLLSGLLNCILVIPLGYEWGAIGAAAAVLITECGILIGMSIGLKIREPNIWKTMVSYK